MSLNVIHDSIDDIPEQYRDLYTEQDGKFHLTGIGGVKTQADIDRLQTGIQKERDDHKKTKQKLEIWADLDHDDVVAKLDRFEELELAAKGKIDDMDQKLEEMTEARVRTRLAPVEREVNALKKQIEDSSEELETLRADKVRRQVHDQVRAAATEGKIRPEAADDVLLLADAVFEVTEDGKVLTKENPYGVAPGITADLWLQDMQKTRPHWWPDSVGGNAKGSGGNGGFSNNPWSREHWNITEQGKIVREQGEDRAKQMAKAAGTEIGAGKPAAKAG